MTGVRPATVDDVPELVRLRHAMFTAMDGAEPAPGPWLDQIAGLLRERLGGDDLAAFVVERPGGLAACAVGEIDRRLAMPRNPSGLSGYLYNVSTDAAYRRRGYSRACVVALLGWFRERGVAHVDLRATPDGEPLYRALGFGEARYPALQLSL